MSMDSDDLNDLAAEYVLGTLAGAERVAFEARLQRDPAAMRAVARWASHLQPLADAQPPMIPPPHLWQRIERELGLPSRSKMRTPMWIAAAVAAALIIVAFLIPDLMFRPTVNSVAQLAPQGGQPAFVVSVLDDQKKLLIRAANVSAVPNQSYELWAVPPAGAAPVSLGVIAPTGETEREVAENVRGLLTIGATLAVSLEPEGGSPTGTPTTVMFAGTLTPPTE
ncbi:anti-sigma factor [Dongia deserti]|uniref:anti-sigma factor n=1 Tax=Dongia deserti TaxID=2268030 RepID=UPI000E64C157|nr:anti-sigma factor [Dongia deserti]